MELVDNCLPDLILLDIMMPGMDGFEVCRLLKDNPETQDIPIIFLTAKTDARDIVFQNDRVTLSGVFDLAFGDAVDRLIESRAETRLRHLYWAPET